MRAFSELTGKEKTIELLRWLLALPAALLGVLAIAQIARLLLPPPLAQPPGVTVEGPSDYQRFLVRALSILMGAVFVIVGARVAPRRRFAAAIVLAVLWSGYFFSFHVLVHPVHEGRHYLSFALAAAPAFCAAAIFYRGPTDRIRPGNSAGGDALR